METTQTGLALEDNKLRKKLFQGIEEVVDKKARHWEFDDHKWEIINPSQRMMYVPKGQVSIFMAKVEMESTKRINKYRDYAQNMSQQFEEYERQSERYYSDMLDKFKQQAREVVQKKQSLLDQLKSQTQEKEAKIERIRDRMVVKSYHGLLSDGEEDPDDDDQEVMVYANLDEYKAYKQDWLKNKEVIKEWVRKFKLENQRNPTEMDTSEIYIQLNAYNDSEKKYLDYKLRMIKNEKLPFEIEEFNSATVNSTVDSTNISGQKGNKDIIPLSKTPMTQIHKSGESKGEGGYDEDENGFQQQVLVMEHSRQLQQDIDSLRADIIQKDKTGKFAQYVEQLKQKDLLLFERAQKMEEVTRFNGLQQEEKQKLAASLREVGTKSLIDKAIGTPQTGFADEGGQRIGQLQSQNNDLIIQIEALNRINGTMLSRLNAEGGKGLSESQLAEISNDVAESQNRMIEAHNDQRGAVQRTTEAIKTEITKLGTEAAIPSQDMEAKRAAKMAELKKILADFQKEVQQKDEKLGKLNAQKEKMSTQFDQKLKKIKSEFASLTVESKEEIKSLNEKLSRLEGDLKKSKLPLVAATKGGDETRKKEIQGMKISFDAQLKDKGAKLDELEKRAAEMTITNQAQSQEISEMRDKFQEAQKANKSLQLKVESFAEAAGETKALKEKAGILKQHLKEATAELDIVSTKYKEEQVKRKKLLNELEDMKGKVRVYCRIRPFTKTEKTDADKAQPCVNITDEVSLIVGTQKNRMKAYNFDSVFGPNSTQEEIFDDTKRLIQSAIDGYNVIIFAYGQTGSGKTFTIQGSPDMPGLTPRAIVEMFEILKTMTNFDIKLKCYMVELYLNALRDLLRPKDQEPRELEIKETPSGMVEIQGVTEVELTSISQTENIFENGLSGRKTRKTAMNDASSRSHLVFSIIVDSTNVNTGVRTIGKLTFVDLAGSEKSSKTGTDAQGQEEANAINLSLSALGNVISALSDGSKFVPYRNHILTKLMKDSLGGTAKTLMFVNCSPSVYNESETKNSLDYAVRVKKIKNQVGKNIASKDSGKYTEALNQMDSMMEKLKALLRSSDKANEWAQLEMELNKPSNPVDGEVDNNQN